MSLSVCYVVVSLINGLKNISMLFKKRLCIKSIRFERVSYSILSSGEETICQKYFCLHRITQYGGSINRKDTVCQVCDRLMKKINVSLSYKIEPNLYYIPSE